jgi:hypothetical protein
VPNIKNLYKHNKIYIRMCIGKKHLIKVIFNLKIVDRWV